MPFGDTAGRARRTPSWVTAATLALLAVGFTARATSFSRAFAPGDSRAPHSRLSQRSEGQRRGRHARAPSEIPARGWKDIVLRVYRNISTHHVLVIAAGVAFYSILAVFPAIAALVSLYGLFADAATVSANLDQLASVLPGGAIDVVRDQMNRVSSQGHGALGVAFTFGLLMALWSANAGIKALFDALNVVYDEQEKRGFIKLNAISLLFTTVSILFMVLAMAAAIALPVVLKSMGFEGATGVLVRLVMAPILFGCVAVGLAALYRYGPSREKPRWRWISWGSAFAAFAWLAASMLFSWYAANFGTFNKTYGSLGAIIGFMTWIWLSAIVLLIGAELNAEMEHQAARDTTVGRPEPMGVRGAKMADSLGAPQD